MKRIAIFACLAVAGCGTTPGVNTDVPPGVYFGVDGRPQPKETGAVTVVATKPAGDFETRAVSGISCKNKLWDPAPSRENAVTLMKNQAAQFGFDAVYGVEVKPIPGAVVLNCWAALEARGTAFRLAEVATEPAEVE